MRFSCLLLTGLLLLMFIKKNRLGGTKNEKVLFFYNLINAFNRVVRNV